MSFSRNSRETYLKSMFYLNKVGDEFFNLVGYNSSINWFSFDAAVNNFKQQRTCFLGAIFWFTLSVFIDCLLFSTHQYLQALTTVHWQPKIPS